MKERGFVVASSGEKNWVFENKDIRLPIVDMARATVSIPVRMRPDQERISSPLNDIVNRKVDKKIDVTREGKSYSP